MGLLDVFNSEEGRLGLGLLAAAGPRPVAQSGFGDRLQDAFGSMDAFKQHQLRNKFMEQQMAGISQSNALHAMQVEQMQREQNKAKFLEDTAAKFAKPASPGSPEIPGITPMDGALPPELRVGYAAIPARPASFDMAGYMGAVMAKHPLEAMRMQQEARKANQVKLGEGENVYDATTGKPIFQTAPKKTGDLREYEYAVENGYKGNLLDWITAQKRAGATTVNTRVENKIGESLAGQVGPMAKDSRIQTQGAVKMFDAADRLEKALDSNKVTSGPFATQIQTAKQLIQVVGGGSDDGIRQTRQAIKSLAQMSVEARKQLQGQGQVTESEAAAVAKADSGELNDLTVGELKDLATLTKRAAHYQAKAHQDMLVTLGNKDETKNLVPFYGVQGLDPLLKHTPTLPQIGGGGWSIKPVGQ